LHSGPATIGFDLARKGLTISCAFVLSRSSTRSSPQVCRPPLPAVIMSAVCICRHGGVPCTTAVQEFSGEASDRRGPAICTPTAASRRHLIGHRRSALRMRVDLNEPARDVRNVEVRGLGPFTSCGHSVGSGARRTGGPRSAQATVSIALAKGTRSRSERSSMTWRRTLARWAR
jgi:hypothetical protein